MIHNLQIFVYVLGIYWGTLSWRLTLTLTRTTNVQRLYVRIVLKIRCVSIRLLTLLFTVIC